MTNENLLQKIEKLEAIIQRQGFNILALHQLAKIIVSNTDIRQIFFLITDMFAEIFQLKYCVSYMFRSEREKFEFSYSIRLDEEKFEKIRFNNNLQFIDRIFKKFIWKIDDSVKNNFDSAVSTFFKNNSFDYIIPFRIFDRRLGFVCFGPRIIETDFDEGDLVLLEIMQNIISTSLYNAMTLDILAEDNATGIFTERYLLRRIDESISLAKRYNLEFTLCLISFSSLKKDTAANRILRNSAEILKNTVRVTDYVARFDEKNFAVLLNRTSGKDIEKPFTRISRKLSGITLSVGCATFPIDGQTRQSLIDVAQDRLKNAGNNEIKYT